MKFSYTSRTAKGQIVEGIIDAPDRFAAATQIRGNGELPVTINELKDRAPLFASIDAMLGRVTIEDTILFCRNLSGMLSAGLALRRGLEILRKQTKKAKLQKVLDTLIADIDAGGTLSSGIAKFPKVFSTLFVSMVRAGEESGSLSDSLKEVGLHLQKAHALTKKIKGAMTYPLIILLAVVGVGVLMLIFVVPTLTKTFAELNVELPMSTRVVIGISDLFAHHLLLICLLIVGVSVAMAAVSRMAPVQALWDRLTVRLPLIGTMIQEINAARTARTLASLLLAGVSIVKALSITGDVVQNSLYKKVITDAVESVEKGVPVSEAFKKHPELYPVMVGEMMAVGEETGRLSGMLTDIASFYEEEVDTKTKNLSTIVEPALMVVIGAAVGFFAVSMITPMYSLLDKI